MKSGFVAIVGRPNVGKSTLINGLVGRKVSIITPKPQTTRTTIQGVLHKENLQIVFLDTPGIHKPRQKLGEAMNKMAYSSLYEVDAILFIVDSGAPFGPGDMYLVERLKDYQNVIIVFNKIDTTNLTLVNNLKEIYKSHFPKAPQIEISAIRLAFLDDIVNTLEAMMPEGPAYFPSETYSNYPEAFAISEIIREKVMLLTKEEIPHVIAVVIDKIEDINKVRHLYASIIVEKDSQKAIVIGHQGQLIKRVGVMARRDLETQYGQRFHVTLFVRVEVNWRDSLLRLKEFGFQ